MPTAERLAALHRHFVDCSRGSQVNEEKETEEDWCTLSLNQTKSDSLSRFVTFPGFGLDTSDGFWVRVDTQSEGSFERLSTWRLWCSLGIVLPAWPALFYLK